MDPVDQCYLQNLAVQMDLVDLVDQLILVDLVVLEDQ
jgi:hypothetical protein